MKNKLKKSQLQAQYRILSEVEELWGVKPSKHRAYLFINNKMREILKEIQNLDGKDEKKKK